MGTEEAALKFSRRELMSSVFDFSRVGFRITSAPAVIMLPVDRMYLVAIFSSEGGFFYMYLVCSERRRFDCLVSFLLSGNRWRGVGRVGAGGEQQDTGSPVNL